MNPDWAPIETQPFYELMQRYRWAGIQMGGDEADVVAAFEAVKDWIRYHYIPRPSSTAEHGK